MAVRTIHYCDAHGEESFEEAVGSATITIDRKNYELDLCEKHLAVLQEFVGVVVETKAKTKTKKSRSRKQDSDTASPTDVRAWALENGYEVNTRGRIPAAIIDAYNAAP